ncbi:MAG: YdbH domain-containing protein [Cellvibrionaceae bacterium]|nr:YdbH domain-containing protein [Cellvibrionaceae bacterium]
MSAASIIRSLRRLAIALALLLLLLALLLVGLAHQPSWLLYLSRYSAQPLEHIDYSVPEFEWQRGPGIKLQQLLLTTASVDINARQLELQLRPWPLSLRKLHIHQLGLQIDQTGASGGEPEPPYKLLQSLAQMPKFELGVDELTVPYGDNQLSGRLTWQHSPAAEQLALSGELQLQLPELGRQQQQLALQLGGHWQGPALALQTQLQLPGLIQLQGRAAVPGPAANWSIDGRAQLALRDSYQRLLASWPRWPAPWLALLAPNTEPQLKIHFDASASPELLPHTATAQIELSDSLGLLLAPPQLKRPLPLQLNLPEPLALSWDGQLSVNRGELSLSSGPGFGRHYGEGASLSIKLKAPPQCRPRQCEPSWALSAAQLPLATLAIQGQLEDLQASGSAQWQGQQLGLQGQLQASLTQLARAELKLDKLSLATGAEGFAVNMTPSSDSPVIQAAIPKLELSAEGGRLGEDFSIASWQLQLSDINVGAGRQVQAALDYAGQLQGLEAGQAMPGLHSNGRIQLSGQQLHGSGQLQSSLDQALLDYQWQHQLAGAQGAAKFSWVAPGWSPAAPLSSWFAPWPFSVDLLGGELGAEGEARWQLSESGPSWQLSAELEQRQLSVVAGDIGLLGVNAKTQLHLDSKGKLAVPPFTLSVASLDMGLPVEDIQLQIAVQGDNYQLDQLRAKLLGGQIEAGQWQLYGPPAKLSSRAPWAIQLSGLDVQALLAAADYPDLDMTMRLAGDIPLRMDNGQPLIEGGKVWGMAPGVIRYRGLSGLNELVDLVSEALSNYHYEKLDSSLSYDDSGYLQMGVKMQGKNPDMDNGRPIHLNLNVSDNIPNLIKSLQASRLITDAIGTKIQQAQ